MPGRNQRVSRRSRDRIIEVVNAERKRLEARATELQVEIKAREAELALVKDDLDLTGRTGQVLQPQRKNGAKRGRRKKVDHAKAAGPANVAAVRDYLVERGRATQADIRKGTGKNSGTVSNALRALEEERVAAPTGDMVGRSAVWALVGSPDRSEERTKEAGVHAMA